MIEKKFTVTCPTGQLFQHVDGGFYKFEKSVWFADDDDELVIYAHIGPFPKMESARRASEFITKFTPITQEYFELIQKNGAEIFQKQIRLNKTQRRKNESQQLG